MPYPTIFVEEGAGSVTQKVHAIQQESGTFFNQLSTMDQLQGHEARDDIDVALTPLPNPISPRYPVVSPLVRLNRRSLLPFAG
jgi:hypothetical protein